MPTQPPDKPDRPETPSDDDTRKGRHELARRLMDEVIDEPAWTKVAQTRAGYLIACTFRLPK